MARTFGPEAAIQREIIRTLALANPIASSYIFFIPNGANLSPNARMNSKRMGLRPGVCDLFLPLARSGYHGLWIEVKAPGNKPREDQREWMAAMEEQGYKAIWGDSVAELVQLIVEYVNGKD